MPDNRLMTSHDFVSPRMCRRHALQGGAALVLSLAFPWAQAKDTHLPRPKSLLAEARKANSQGEPLVLLVSLPGCPYCELVRRNYLKPMREQEGLAAWQVDIHDKKNTLTGWDGQPTTGHALSRHWAIQVTPTVLFLDAHGREIAPRLEGVAVVDFYGTYLEERLKQAREALKAATGKPPA